MGSGCHQRRKKELKLIEETVLNELLYNIILEFIIYFMKKLLLLIAWIFSVAVLVWCGWPKKGEGPAAKPSIEAKAQKKAPTDAKVAFAGYKEFSSAELAKATKEGKKTGIFFHSKTCSSCAKLEADIVANEKDIPNDVVLLKADWDDNQALALEYDVDTYHTVAYLWENQKSVKGLFSLKDLLAQFDVPSPLQIAPKVEEAKEEMKEKVEEAKEEMQEEVEEAKEEMEEEVQEAKEEMEEKVAEAKEEMEEKVQEAKKEMEEDGVDDQPVKLASYDTYSPEAFDAAVAWGNRVVLNFRASRCPNCKRVAEETIERVAELPSDVVILEADYDTYTDLKEKYGVVKQTTFSYFDAKGTHLKTVENVRSFDDLVSEL